MINMMQILQMLQGGTNPVSMLQQMMGQDPRAGQAMKLLQGKSPQQMRTMAQNMAQQRGMSLEQLAGQFGLHLPK